MILYNTNYQLNNIVKRKLTYRKLLDAAEYLADYCYK